MFYNNKHCGNETVAYTNPDVMMFQADEIFLC